jgi:broad specificity phosphatase PhoE
MGLLLLVRHGQASFGSDDYDVLSENGWEQGRLLGAHLARAGVRPDAVVRGGLRRHRETLEAVCAGAGWELPVAEDDRWDEFDHLGVVARFPGLPADLGDPHRMDRRAFQDLFEQATARWTAGLDEPGEGEESFLGFGARTSAALASAAASTGSGATTVVVSSGGVIALLAAELLGLRGPALAETWQRLNTVCVNSAVTRVMVGSRGARLLTFNEHEHLPRDLVTYR